MGLDTATDREIWTYAGEHGYLLVSKDSDFRQLAFLFGPPPKACLPPLPLIAELLRRPLDDIARFAASDEEAFLVLPNLGG